MSAVPWASIRGETDSSSTGPVTNGFSGHRSSNDNGDGSNYRSSTDDAQQFDVKVGRVPVSASKEDLTAMFESVGEVLRVNILAPKDGYDTTLAFIRYGDQSEAEGAVENLNGYELDGKELRVELAPKRDRPQRDGPVKSFGDSNDRQAKFADLDGKQVRVLNIPMSLSEDAVKELFQSAGDVVSVRLLPPKDGYDSVAGFLTFSEIEEANTAVENLNGTSIDGCNLRVQIAKSRSNNQPRESRENGSAISPPWKQSSQSDTQDGEKLCRRCQKPGHFAYACPETPSCHKCGSPDHLANSCTAIGQNRNSSSGDGGITCHRCGEEGHMARDCVVAPENSAPPVTYVPKEPSSEESDIFLHTTAQGINFEKYEKIPVEITGKDAPKPINTFKESGLHQQCQSNIVKANYHTPTPVQRYSLPAIMADRDLMACAQTGSGKTAAFLLPIISKILTNGLPPEDDDDGPARPLAAVIAPTRELAIQIQLEVRKFTYGSKIRSCVIYGGVSVNHQLSMMRNGHHIVVGTPGRLNDFVKRGRLSFSQLQFFVLDEADRMLDMGFLPQINSIKDNSHMPPNECRQTLMFSATFPEEIQRLAADFLNDNYLFLTVGRLGSTSSDIEQCILEVPNMQKRDKLERILTETGGDRTLVFVELKRSADFLASYLSQKNFPTTSISSDRTQEEREDALDDFRKGLAVVLVATAVAARGLDIEGVKHVINYDLPSGIDEYVHRIGRTGRIGNQGKATSFYEEGRDDKLARGLVKVLSEASQVVPEWLENLAMSAVGTGYGPAGGKFSSRDTRERPSGVQNTRFSSGSNRDERPATNGFQREQRAPFQSNGLAEPAESWD